MKNNKIYVDKEKIKIFGVVYNTQVPIYDTLDDKFDYIYAE